MVDAVVTVFLEKLLNVLTEESQFLSNSREQFENLKTELLFMESFLKDADRLKRKNSTLLTAMMRLRDLIYQAEDILIDCLSPPEYRNSRFSICFHPAKLPFHYRLGKRLAKINVEITQIKQNISIYLGVPLLNQTNNMETHEHLMDTRWGSSLYNHTQVFGLEADTEKIKNWLFEASYGILAIGVVGMGGLGKTTIAEQVFNEKTVENRFDRRIWVSVSQTFTVEKIMRSILRSFGDACQGDDQSELLKKINQYLLGKRYLIVMDDVWTLDTSWWWKIYEGLPQGNGSCVMITTRNEEVAQKMGVREERTHRPKFLNEENSWLLFSNVAFAATPGKCIHRDIKDVGKEIVEKCKGLPLAIKAVGGVMLCKPPHYHEWKRISDHFREELAQNDNSVKASLQLSYDELPPYLKPCFLCFSLFPEDCEIDKEQLIYWWIGESFIPVRNHRLSTEVAEDCFSELTNRCLIETVDRAYNGTVHTCKIHDMVRDLVIRIAEDEAFSIPTDRNCRHLGIGSDMSTHQLVANDRLRALLTTTKSGEVNKIGSNLGKSFCRCKHLQVLDLSKSNFESSLACLLDEIGSLQHLTYFSLSNTHPVIKLPRSMSKLQKLQVLDVSYCQNLKMLPSCIVAFEKLKVLNVSNCGSLEYLPRGLEKLSDLEVLKGFKPAKSGQSGGCQIAELKSLKRLRALGLRLTHGDELGDAEFEVLVNLKKLQFLTINCFGCRDEDLAQKIDKLQPPRQLHELSLKFFPGKLSPVWLSPKSLPELCYLSISSGNLAKMNNYFWGHGNAMWRVEALQLDSLSDLSEEWSMVHQAMPSLRILNVSWCPELVAFPIEDAGFRGGVWKKEDQRT